MTWFKVDDGFWCNPKTLQVSNDALALWLRAGTWASQQLTDGHVPARALGLFAAGVDEAEELVAVGLWDAAGDGYEFHDWDDYQPSAAVEKAKRAARAAAGRKGAEARWGSNPDGKADAKSHGKSHSNPDGKADAPSRPVPSSSSTKREGAATRGHRIPEPFIVTAEMRAWAAQEVPGVDVDASTRRFVDYWRAESGAKATKKDWVATWRNWLRRDHENGRGRQTFAQQKQNNTLALLEQARAEEKSHEVLGDGGVAGVRELPRGEGDDGARGEVVAVAAR